MGSKTLTYCDLYVYTHQLIIRHIDDMENPMLQIEHSLVLDDIWKLAFRFFMIENSLSIQLRKW